MSGIRKRKPAHWRAPEVVILVRALHRLGVRRKLIMAMTGISDTCITGYVTRSERHRIAQEIAQPNSADLMAAAVQLARYVAGERAPREHVKGG